MRHHRQVHNIKPLLEKRKELRNNGTSAEATLWKHLQRSQLDGRKFRRQHSIDHYIVDFYCPSEKLIVELDGHHHFTEEGQAYDEARTKHIANYSIKVIRFENQMVFNQLDDVLNEIRKHFNLQGTTQ